MKKTKLPKGPDFPIHEELINFAKESPPSIIDKTCPTISTLILALNDEVRVHYVGKIVEDMIRSGSGELKTLEKWGRLYSGSIEKYIPKILTERKWIYLINEHILGKLKNELRAEARKEREREKRASLYRVNKETGEESEIPELGILVDYTKILEKIDLEELIQKAKFKEIDNLIYICKVVLELNGKDTAKEIEKRLGKIVSERTVNDKYQKIIKRLVLITLQDRDK